MYNICEGLALAFVVRIVQPSGLINRSQRINVTMKCTRHAKAPGLQCQKRRRPTVEKMVTVSFSSNKFPATVLICHVPVHGYKQTYNSNSVLEYSL